MNSTNKAIAYSAQTLNIKNGVGSKFINNFEGRFKAIPAIKEKLQKAIALSKEKNNKPLIISFASQKGGVGKSTMAVATSQLLANLGFNVYLVDIDNTESSHSLLNTRKKNIQEIISNAVKDSVDESEIIKFKESIDPLVDSALVDKEFFTVNFANEIATGSSYDIIIFDTAGVKDNREENFDINKLNHAGEVHLILSYLSNCIVVPMRITPLDIAMGTRFYYPLSQFIFHLEQMKINVLKTQARILVNASERVGTGVKALEEFQKSSYKQFKTIIRRSDKIAFASYLEGVQTAFTTKVAAQMQESCLDVIDQIADDALVSLEV